MSAHLTMLGDDLGRVQSEAELEDGAIWLRLHDSSDCSAHLLISRAEAAKIMADLATAMGLLEAPKVAARKPLIVL